MVAGGLLEISEIHRVSGYMLMNTIPFSMPRSSETIHDVRKTVMGVITA
jgi:hypothetical protein